ncbi:Serendipity locus protein H-1 [Orchesella cincta]|uniref:Serendipity locus protein H-1 n=1 Tax=Orchesella cincta TaxID=48709 RepID=A0A1D2M5T4_ORCCI|nr:Serendipity locus protein H-1 [Orchesella cincta]
MGSANPANCPICGDVSVPLTPNLTGTNLQKKVEELENKIKSHEKVLQARFSSSEVKFERNKLYEKDGRYLSFRKYIRVKLESVLPKDDDDDLEEEMGAPQRKKPFRGKRVKVETEDEPMGSSILDDVENIMEEVVSEDDKSEANYEEDIERKEEVLKPRRESSSSTSVSEQEEIMVEEDEGQHVESSSLESEDGGLQEEHTNKTSRSGREVKDLKEHMKGRHPAPKKLKYECHLCKRKFQTGGKLRGHVKQAHAVVGGWECEVCGREFKFERYLNEHKLVHETVKRFSCNLCGTGFTKNSVMQRHIKNIHEGMPRTDTRRKRRKSNS